MYKVFAIYQVLIYMDKYLIKSAKKGFWEIIRLFRKMEKIE